MEEEFSFVDLSSTQLQNMSLSSEADSELLSPAELVPESVMPSTTAELVGMLKQAGTELTIKYITGEMSFEDFCLELEKLKPNKSPSKPASASTQSSSKSIFTMGSVPSISKQVDEGDEEDMEEEDDDDEENEEEEDSEFVDAGEMVDKHDEEWIPGAKFQKLEKGKRGKPKEAKGELKHVEFKKPRRKRRKLFDLPKDLAGINGRAMLLRAQGKTDEAVNLLYEIINRAPKAAAPYHALGSIHEEKGDIQQALKFYMVAANLRGQYATEWMELAEMCINLNDEKMSTICFQKALKNATSNSAKLEILSRKCALLESFPIKVLHCREQMLQYMDRSNTSTILTLARNIANDYMEFKEEDGAISVLEYIHKEFPNDIDSEDVHNLAELLMSQKHYDKSLEIIVRHCGVDLIFCTGTPSSEELLPAIENFISKEIKLERLKFPSLMPIDLKSKLVQCIVYTQVLTSLDILRDLIKSLIDMDVEAYGDVHYDIAEPMVECGYFEEAKPILYSLVNSEKYNKAAVWLTYGQCLNALGDIKGAAEAYTQVVEKAPGHYGARVTLSSLLQQMGQNEVALDVLSKGSLEEGEATADQLLLIHKCQLLHSQGKIDEFIATARKLLSYHFPGQLKPDFIKVLLGMRTSKSRRSILPQFMGSSKKLSKEKKMEAEATENKELKGGEERKFRANLWDIHLKVCRAMHEKGLMDDLLETATLGMICPVFAPDQAMVKDAEFMCMKVGSVGINIYHLARNMIVEEKDNNQAWNLYNYVVTRLKEVTDLRFATRALMKNPDSLALGMLNGNARMISGTYKQALGEYLAVFRQTPDNDMALLCSALCLVHIASQSYISRKNPLLAQVICLMNAYKEMRGECQESYYNMGRAMHQLNIIYAAVYYYKKALEFPPIVVDEQGTFDLSHEIAYNLALIYNKSNNPEMASYYIEKYCVI
ncbi:general transcription factor 3C polypeptide 3-like [Physella acuta]|uniref:general transcription factor 3C polypeptide 3-like n=1 Tax=Physella acuta TaxID=109671 RepID=UPI0027DE0F9E|nr:general transcription factor 3C polypeptide 3-like [Physella acuta]